METFGRSALCPVANSRLWARLGGFIHRRALRDRFINRSSFPRYIHDPISIYRAHVPGSTVCRCTKQPPESYWPSRNQLPKRRMKNPSLLVHRETGNLNDSSPPSRCRYSREIECEISCYTGFAIAAKFVRAERKKKRKE